MFGIPKAELVSGWGWLDRIETLHLRWYDLCAKIWTGVVGSGKRVGGKLIKNLREHSKHRSNSVTG